MEEKKVSVDGIETNFKVAGEGPAVLILHGWGSSSDSWVAIQEKIAEKDFFVICPDLPGFGKTKTPPHPWGVSDYVNWVLEFTETQGLDNFFLLSHSFGGRVALQLAAQNSQRILGMILCDAAGIKREPGFKTKLVFLAAKVGNVLLAPKVLTRLKDTARNVFYLFLRNTDYVKADKTMRETLKKVLEKDIHPFLPKINTKTLIIWGRRDKMVPLEDAHVLKNEIKNASLKILPKVDHSPHLQAPDELSRLAIDFLNDLR